MKINACEKKPQNLDVLSKGVKKSLKYILVGATLLFYEIFIEKY